MTDRIMEEPVTLKGLRRGKRKELHLLFSETAPFDALLDHLSACLVRIDALVHDAAIVVNIGQRDLSEVELLTLQTMIGERFPETPVFWDIAHPNTMTWAQQHACMRYPTSPFAAAPMPVVERPVTPATPLPTGREEEEAAPSEEGPSSQISEPYWPGATARIVRGMLRSGQRETSEESIVILGDVNPGAEVFAKRDIIVLGALRGIAHAGVPDQTDACVFALHLQPTQLRIAHLITRAPAATGPLLPEIARIKEGQIVVETYKGSRFKA
ncbi:MAG: hypothetical protein D6795_12830 [Deltaproteobacteria bacterium]|nr:MAG: hypothetical protein D6795_12830 [Deltaproteobacteria bacterium]